ncbi:Uncharacterized protein TCM_003987 [Theobroma cacao]|uniref:Uncharacterized protein n=1 Tax=Theobroma cacao TaxID=3641 RepID=A0A061DPQ3_THECC|nr:Uncharacterized protein TCM_003987 [Theobroma cacao]
MVSTHKDARWRSNKTGYLTGEEKKFAPQNPNLGTWINKDHKMKSWLIDSMSQSLMQRFIRLPTTNEIQEAISKIFYDGLDETCIFLSGLDSKFDQGEFLDLLFKGKALVKKMCYNKWWRIGVYEVRENG